MAETAESKWSQLPKDLLHTISKTFNTHLDVISVRSVCSSWRSSIPPFKKNPPLPLNLPFPIAPNPALNPNRRGHFSLTQSTIYILQNPNSSKSTASASKPWLIRVEETRRGKLRPLNPLSRILTENTPVAYPKSLNLLDTRISEIGKAYNLEFVETSKNIDREFGELKSILGKKAVVSSAPWIGDDYTVMVIHGGKLGFIKLGDGTWSLFDDPKQCDDVVYHKGKFYAVDYKGRTVLIGLDLKAKEVAGPFFGRGGGQSKQLIKSFDDLFLIDKYMGGQEIDFVLGEYSECELHLRVFKLNEEKKRWDFVDTLGDQVFFVGDDCSYAVRAQDFPGLRGDCVYFSDDSFDGENEALGEFCVDTGVYRLVDGKCGALSAFRRHSPIFWPPPTWLSSKSSCSKK